MQQHEYTPSQAPSEPPQPHPRDGSLQASIREGMASSVMLGAGETYLGAYAVFLQGTALQIGLLGTIPLVFSALTQLAAVWLITIVKSRRKVLVRLSLLQAFCWVLAACLPAVFGIGSRGVTALIVIVLLYHALNGLIIPIWNSLIGDLVPAELRGSFFGRRSRFISLASFIAIIGAGKLLYAAERIAMPLLGYTCIFSTACLARLGSSYYLTRHADPPFSITPEHHFSFWNFLRRGPRSNFARFVFFAGLVNFSVYFAAPYFAIYMLRDLKLTYLQYTMVLGAAFVSQIVTLQYWGALSDRAGNKKILDLCVYGVAIVPLFWLFGSALWWLILLQLFSGFTWAGYNLAVANFLFDAVTPPKRARCVAYQSVVNSVFLLAGSLLGAYTATHASAVIPFERWFEVPASPYLFIFLISGMLRLLVAIFFRSIYKEVRDVETMRKRDLVFRIVHIRPPGRFVFRPIDSLTNEHGRQANEEELER